MKLLNSLHLFLQEQQVNHQIWSVQRLSVPLISQQSVEMTRMNTNIIRPFLIRRKPWQSSLAM